MAFEAPQSCKSYPPAAFRSKYEKFLAPHGLLLPPKQVFKNKKLGPAAEDNLKKAFMITVNKLNKRRDVCPECGKKPDPAVVCGGCRMARYCSELCREPRRLAHSLVCDELRQEFYDQLLECLPDPLLLGREVLKGKGGYVRSWSDWFDTHTSLRDNVRSATSVVSQWWDYTGTKHPGATVIQASLERSVTNIFSTVLTIANSVFWLRQPELFGGVGPTSSEVQEPLLDADVNIHLIGADKPEVTLVESGLIQVCSRVLQGRNVNVTLVAPDLTRHPQTLSLSPAAPAKVGDKVSVGCYPGLYHSFWHDHVDAQDPNNKVPRPTVAVAIHPGCHTPEMWRLWLPTFELLLQEKIPILLTTYNKHEHDSTLKVMRQLRPSIRFEGRNSLASLLAKQTPYEPDHVWASNAYIIGITHD
ncbi:putative protein MSS51 homolog, mitochondrial isoform X2 [Hyalella azteca]|uniref:MYND-type domain-containing protein n=1 Tax=Hyalella azteca TaxID=294128 RepID=A0A8B7NPP5_HYAAZ|nr:putative protein MSS51 homolog, mitochondrial isoform X2 [Hyalella azteca]